MFLDARTLIFAGAVVALVTGSILLITRRAFPRSIRGLEYWGAANLAAAAGAVAIATRGIAPDFVSIVLGNTLVTAGHMLHYAAILQFRRRAVPTRALGLLLVAVFAGTAAGYWLQSIPLRVTVFAFGAAIPIALSARNLFVHAAAEERHAARFTAASLALLGLIITVRLIALFAAGPGAVELFGKHLAALAFLALYDTLVLLATLGFLMLANDRLRAELQRLAMLDPLTEALNRRSFGDFVRRELARSQRSGSTVSLLMMDLDRFKHINDRFGHESGDKVIRSFVETAHRCLRNHDLLARYGGEEFCVLLPDTPLAEAQGVAERLREAVSRSPVRIGNHSVSFSVSIGVACSEQFGRKLDALLRAADTALYRAKELGRNRSVLAKSVPASAQR